MSRNEEWAMGRELPPHPDAENYKEAERLTQASAAEGRIRLQNERCMEIVGTHLQQERVLALMKSLEAKDATTAYHSIRAAALALDVAREMSLNMRADKVVVLAGLLHDIGKREVPAAVLAKSGRLTPEEQAVMQNHVRAGITILQSSEAEGIANAEEVIAAMARHHEYKREGAYPRAENTGNEDAADRRRESDPELELLARILAVSESFDAQTSDRPYRTEPLSKKQVVENMKNELVQELADLIDTVATRYPEAAQKAPIRRP